MPLLLAAAGCARVGPEAGSSVPSLAPKGVTPATPPAPQVHARPSIEAAIADGVAFLVANQQPDGSWGTGRVTHGNEIYHSVPGSHHAFRTAVTALAVMALREVALDESPDAPAVAAQRKAVEFLIADRSARRQEGQLIYNIWAHLYGLQALSIEMRHSDDSRLRAAAEWHLDRLARYETYMGGWNYYDFVAQARQPSMGPTSFSTAAGLVALWEARKSGIVVPQPLIDRACRRLEEMRLPNGAYLYGHDYQFMPLMDGNMPRGSVGRSQAANFALSLWKSKRVDAKRAANELPRFFEMQPFMDMGRKKPIPHESWYMTAGYYFYFGHYYAARVLETMDDRTSHASKLAGLILPLQEPDGSWWDYPMWDYDKIYGTSFALMTLQRCR
jgi:hypothetical protein